MPSKRNKQLPLQPKYNRPNEPVRINEGQAARARGDKASGAWRFPKNLTIKNPAQIIATISGATNTSIWYDEKFEFFFWGSPDNVARAKVDLETNIIQDNPTFQHRYQSIGPPRDAQFEAMGSFVWPSKEYSPEKELGERNFDRLNQIRQENNCHIEYDVSRSSFIVRGSAVRDVQEALLRIKGLLCKVVAQSSPIQRLYLIQNDCPTLSLKDHALPLVYTSGGMQQPRFGKTAKSKDSILKQEDVLVNARLMKDRVMQTLSKVHWHQGHIDFRVHLGTLVLLSYKPFTQIDLADYKDMLADSYNFRAKVTEELGDKELENSLLHRFLSATDSFDPCDRFTNDLADTKPEYTASIEVDLKDGRGNVLITKKWHQDNGTFRQSEPEYKRLEGNSGRTRFLEVCVTDTVTDLTWLLDISALKVQESTHLPQWIREHGDYYVNIDAEKARLAQSFCEFETLGRIPKPLPNKRAIREKIIWRFEMKAPYIGYEVELAKVFNKGYTPTPGAVGGREAVTSFEERWTVDVKHRQWSTQLAENHELRVGKGGEWKADIQSWFPVDSDDRQEKLKGHIVLLQVLQRVQDIVTGRSH
ncbi:hypothetical protein D6C76_04714 [Aureobasidium pullulans]|nr:hypothetical protein D6C76_04714 [Aureobasidium pullulans]